MDCVGNDTCLHSLRTPHLQALDGHGYICFVLKSLHVLTIKIIARGANKQCYGSPSRISCQVRYILYDQVIVGNADAEPTPLDPHQDLVAIISRTVLWPKTHYSLVVHMCAGTQAISVATWQPPALVLHGCCAQLGP